jgi:Na+-driven multidrug efflux pump
VKKTYKKGKVTAVDRKLVHGTAEGLAEARESSCASNKINTAFVERQNGTDRTYNARKVRRTCQFSKDLLVHVAVMFTFAAVLQLFRDEILTLFSSDPEVLRVGSEYLWYLSLNFLLWAFYFVFLRSLQGAGDFVVPMAISLGAALLVALPLAWALSSHTSLGPTGIWIGQLASTTAVTAGTAIWMATGRWTRRARQPKGE